MTQQEKEYQEFYAKFVKLSKEFIDEFNKLSSENKQHFQNEIAQNVPWTLVSFQNFLQTRF